MDDDRNENSTAIVNVKGVKPKNLPPLVQEFYKLERSTIEALVDSSKYYVSTAGISLSIYAVWVQNTVKGTSSFSQRLILFLPIVLWFGSILSGVFAVYPKKYIANNDYSREQVIIKLRQMKLRCSFITLILFGLGFAFAVYSFASKIWTIYPFS